MVAHVLAWHGAMPLYSDQELQARHDELLLFGVPKDRGPSWIDEYLSEIMWPPKLRGLRRAMIRSRATVGERVSDLMALTTRARRQAVQKPPYRHLSVAARLLEERRRVRFADPHMAFQLAQSAVWISDLASPDGDSDLDRSWHQDLRARARCDLADAQRLRRRWRDAEAAYRDAALVLTSIPESPENSYFAVSLAYLYEDLGELDWAAALLGWAAEALLGRHRYCWGLDATGCLCRLGFVHLRRSEPGSALAIFAALLADRLRDTWSELKAKAQLGTASCLLAMGMEREARRHLEDSCASRGNIEDRDERVLVEWLACRLRVRLGDLELAVPRLEAIHRRFVGQGRPVDACLCALDLALAYVQRDGESSGFLDTFDKIVDGQENRWARQAVRVLRQALRHHPDPAAAARAAAFQIGHQWRIGPGRRVGGLGNADRAAQKASDRR
jgi:hypothetical protein